MMNRKSYGRRFPMRPVEPPAAPRVVTLPCEPFKVVPYAVGDLPANPLVGDWWPTTVGPDHQFTWTVNTSTSTQVRGAA